MRHTLLVVLTATLVAGCRRDVVTEPQAALSSAVRSMAGTRPSPLFIIDGVPAPVIARADVDKLDIASVEVVRGQAAVDLYGARAANGVVAITTTAAARRGGSRAPVTADPRGDDSRSARSSLEPAADSMTRPLYILDGVPLPRLTSDSLEKLNIESIEVVKGAAAVALYGERGRNGVIAIRTKGAKKK
jgi:TonB-dependent SusC/RagA subfamily outer membrane receptor